MTENEDAIFSSDNSNIPFITEYIGDDKYKCFYLYMDMIKYGTKYPDMELWISKRDDEINGVAYRYMETIHLYSKERFPLSNAIKLIKQYHPKCITGPKESIDHLYSYMQGEYVYELNYIITTDHLISEAQDLNVSVAKEKDVADIVALMMKDRVYFSVYTETSLEYQIRDRIKTRFGRFFLLRDEHGRLMAANATQAETKTMAVVGSLITDPDLRGRGLGRAITASTWNRIFCEGKKGLAYILADNVPSVVLHQKMGFNFFGTYARLLRST